MTTTLEEQNAALRNAVEERLANSCCEGTNRTACVLPQGFTMKRLSNGSEEWLAALDRLRALHHEKTAQYGGSDDAFENVTASAKCGVEPWRRALCDLSDCVVRMQKYAQGQPVDPTNALLDAANWALICLIKMEEAANATIGPRPLMR